MNNLVQVSKKKSYSLTATIPISSDRVKQIVVLLNNISRYSGELENDKKREGRDHFLVLIAAVARLNT